MHQLLIWPGYWGMRQVLKPKLVLTLYVNYLVSIPTVFFRQMCGVHYRMDSEEGLLLGEIVGVRMLQQVNTRTQQKQGRTDRPPLSMQSL